MFKLSRRDLVVALFAVAGTCCVTVFAQSIKWFSPGMLGKQPKE